MGIVQNALPLKFYRSQLSLLVFLVCFCCMKGQTLTEFSSELDIPKSTLQSVMIDGNTTVDTLIRMSNALNESLDKLVFGECPTKRISDVMQFINEVSWFVKLSSEKQEKFRYHLNEMLILLDYEI